MAYEIAVATDAGAGGLAHYDLLDRIKTFVTTNVDLIAAGQDWEVLRYDTVSAERELILKGRGLSGTEEIFVGIKCYQDAGADYYNLAVASFKGYASGNSFETQPGASPTLGVPAHNLSIAYWLRVNGQSITCAMKVGTPVYECFQVGKFFPFATPGQYPQPLIAAGMLSSASATRYSETAHQMPWVGNRSNLRMHFNDGVWKTPYTFPWGGGTVGTALRDTSDTYYLSPVLVFGNLTDIYGQLDGVYHITGFNNVVENTLTIGGKDYVVIQNVSRTGFADYFAMELS